MKDNSSASDVTQIYSNHRYMLVWPNNREKTDPKSNPRRMLPQSMSSDAFSRSARRDRNQDVVGNRVASTGKWSAPRTNTGAPLLHSCVSFGYATSRENHLIHHPVRSWLIYVSTDGQYYCVSNSVLSQSLSRCNYLITSKQIPRFASEISKSPRDNHGPRSNLVYM